MSSKKIHVNTADPTPSSPQKKETNRSALWKDTTKQSRRFFLDPSRAENPKMTWFVLIGVFFFAVLFGVFMILWLPQEKKKTVPPLNPMNQNAAPRVFSPLRTFSLDQKAPSAWCSGENNTFLLADAKRIVLYDLDGKKIRSWEPETLNFKTTDVDKQEKNGSASKTDPAVSPDKSILFRPGKTTAIFYKEYRDKEKTMTSYSLYIAAGNQIAVISSREDVGSRLLLNLDKNALITSMKIISHYLFLADYNNKAIYRYDLKNLGDFIVMGKPDPEKENGFPGFQLSVVPHFDLAANSEDQILYAANPVMFRVEAFNAESGSWNKDRSWGKHPEQGNGFSGCCNPIYLDVFPNGRILTAEKGKESRLKVFDPNGSFLYDLNEPGKSIPLDGKTSLIPIIINDTSVLVLHPNGEAKVFVQNHESPENQENPQGK
ncbi:MAG: hypothetical protein Q4G69_10655 [Planctomycetia bacterium]|nr:hypothetical protein [Planctomycetia bacterium]